MNNVTVKLMLNLTIYNCKQYRQNISALPDKPGQ